MAEVPSQTGFVGFVPGNAVAVVGGRTVALLETDPRSQLVADLSEAIRSDADLDLLTAILVGAGLRSLPPLALVQIEDGVARAILRGDIVVAARTASNETGEEIRSGEVLTWVEHVVQDVEHVEIRRVGETSEISVFKFSEGVVPAARLEVTVARESSVTRSTPPSIPDNRQVQATVPNRGVDMAVASDAIAGDVADRLPVSADPDESSQRVERHSPQSGGAGSDDSDPVGTNETVSDDEEVARADTDDEDVRDNKKADDSVSEGVDQDGGASPADTEGRTLTIADVQPDLLEDGAGDADVDVDTDSEPEAVERGADVFSSDESGQTLEPVRGTEPSDESEADDGYDHLFGATEHRPLSLAGIDDDAVVEAGSEGGLISSVPGGGPTSSAGGTQQGLPAVGTEGSAAGADPAADAGDHDGMTISLAQLRAAQGAGVETPDPAPQPSVGSSIAEVVHAISCPSGHLNPPAAASCRVCGVEVATQEHVSVPRPVLGVLRFSNGDEYPLLRSILMGRAPKASGTSQGNQLPELITLESSSRELSGTHLEIRLEGWQVLAIDRRSTNGTTVALPGRDPQRLHPGNAIPIVPGTVIDMAEEIQFTYEVTE